MAEEYYLWSDFRNGGETDLVRTPNGGERAVVLSREVTPFGTKVTKRSLDLEDDEWNALVEGGVVRPYAPPDMKGAGPDEAPIDYVRRLAAEQATSEEERLLAGLRTMGQTQEELANDQQALSKAQAEKEKTSTSAQK